jgi:hypothetical protein
MIRRLLRLAIGLALAQGSAMAADYDLPPGAGPVMAANPFLGGYAAVGGAYGISAPRSFSVSSSASTSCCSAFSVTSGNGSPAGRSGIAAADYNMAFGPAVIGIELDGRWGSEGFDKKAIVPAFSAGSSSGGGPVAHSYAFKNDAGVHLSARFGAVLGGSLIFAKLGAGASRFTEVFAADQSAAFICQSINFSNLACISPTFGGANTYTATRWVPSLIFGIGGEQNFGVFFGRAMVEVETVAQDTFSLTQPTGAVVSFSGSSSTLNTQWTARAIVMGGQRL